LRRDGYHILRANSGEAGLDLLSKNNVGVIISDQRMPGMTGVEFLGKVRELYPDTVRVVLSGYTDLSTIAEAINHGAIYKFLTKPWEDELLRANVEEAFQRYELKSENRRLTRDLQTANEALQLVNQGLVQRVKEKSGEAIRNLNFLQVSQEILERLPVAVIGVGDDGVIAIANRSAHRLFSEGRSQPLLGEIFTDAIPAEFLSAIADVLRCKFETKNKCNLADGRSANYWCSPMGDISHSKGVVLVIAVDV
jgi:response regulator RpfG family c-di-GMP phosphodiesterase